MIGLCGKFSKDYLYICKNKTIYFDKNCRLKNSNDIIPRDLNKLLENIDDKQYWLNIIQNCLQLDYRYRKSKLHQLLKE